MNQRQMVAALEALEMARDALNGELGEREIELAKTVINLRIAMFSADLNRLQREDGPQ